MMRDGWRQCRLGDLFDSRKERGRPGLPLLSVTMNDGLVDREDLDRKQDTTLTPEEHLLVKPGDIAYNTMRMWQGAFGLARREGLVSPAYVVLKPKESIDPRFAAYMFESRNMRHRLWAYSYGLTDDRLRLYFDDLAKIPAAIPAIDEQKRIADALAVWDSAVTAARSHVDNSLRQLGFVRARLLAPKASWITKSFDETFRVANRKDAQVASTAYLPSGQVPVVDQGPEQIAGYVNDDEIIVAPPKIVFGDHTRTVKWIDFPFRPGADGTQLLVPTPETHPRFAFHLLADTPIKSLGYSRHMSELRQKLFRMPVDVATQAQIAGVIDTAEDCVLKSKVQLELLGKERAALLSKLVPNKRLALDEARGQP